tara:strand:- start:406 stop:618 length:213 start_codon:yes stop_codon:yes gene_type:complete
MTDFNSKEYKELLRINNKRSELAADVNTEWTPLDECVHIKLYEAQAELVNLWVEKEEERHPPRPPMSPFS